MRSLLILVLFLCASLSAVTQNDIIFSKAQHDFGKIAPTDVAYEQDFLFRNTSQQDVKVLTVISSSPKLEVIHTRSAIAHGEYGFVKIKLSTDSIDGLFNEFIEIKIESPTKVYSERLFVRALVSKDGTVGQQRSFTDSEIALTVEVSPDDVEDMEGFLGKSRIEQAETEITYLRRQLKLQADLLFRYSEDLKLKQAQEQENISKLAELEKGIRNKQTDEAILTQIDQLSSRLKEIQASDQKLRSDIARQERDYERLKNEADSARSYAEELSKKLTERFQNEAAAIERAQNLEKKLKEQQSRENRHQQRIDSLQNLIASQNSQDESYTKRLEQLKLALEEKSNEHRLQAEQARKQEERIQLLKSEREKFKLQSDSLSQSVAEQSELNADLTGKLAASENRLKRYQNRLDSLKNQVATQNSSEAELAELNEKLASLKNKDSELNRQIASQKNEISSLEAENDQARNELKAMKAATEKQLGEAHKLMYRINELSSKESAARMETARLRNELNVALQKEDSSRHELTRLKQKLENKEGNIALMESELSAKKSLVDQMLAQKNELNSELEKTNSALNSLHSENDSLNLLMSASEKEVQRLQSEMQSLQEELLRSRNKQIEASALTADLQSQLTNAKMSNELTFSELSIQAQKIAEERDQYKSELSEAELRILDLEKQLKEANHKAKSAMAFVNEFRIESNSSSDDVVFRVEVMQSSQKVDSQSPFRGHKPVFEFRQNDMFVYALGYFNSIDEAKRLEKQLKTEGFGSAKVIAFRGKQKISLEEALDTALSH